MLSVASQLQLQNLTPCLQLMMRWEAILTAACRRVEDLRTRRVRFRTAA
jgi:hypothetical protein